MQQPSASAPGEEPNKPIVTLDDKANVAKSEPGTGEKVDNVEKAASDEKAASVEKAAKAQNDENTDDKAEKVKEGENKSKSNPTDEKTGSAALNDSKEQDVKEKETGEKATKMKGKDEKKEAPEATEKKTEQQESAIVKTEGSDGPKAPEKSEMEVDTAGQDNSKNGDDKDDGGDEADKKPPKPTKEAKSAKKAAANKGRSGGSGDNDDDADDADDGDDDDEGDDDDKDDKDHNPEEHADDDDDDDDDEQMLASASDSARRSSGEQATPRRSTRKRRRPATEPEVETATPRRLRPRNAAKPATPSSSAARRSSPAQSSSTAAPSVTNPPPSPPRVQPAAAAPAGGTRDLGSLGESAPRPVDGAEGKVMRIGDVHFVTYGQLSVEKRGKLAHKKVAPIEALSFTDIRKYNRDQLRSYCVVYNIPRGKKTEMEAYMARFVCWWNNGEGEFALHKYEPTKGNNVRPFNPDGLLRKMLETRSTPKLRKSPDDAKPAPSPAPSTTTAAVPAGALHAAATPPAEQTSLAVPPSLSRRSSGRVAQQPVLAPGAAPINGMHPKPGPVATPNAVAGASAAPTPAPARPRSTTGAAVTTRGAATSFKQKVHARQAGAKFKAAYNGAGPAIVNIVENAAAYFEGRDAPEVLRDQSKSYARYQFNVDLLTEIFDGPVLDTESDDAAGPGNANSKSDGNGDGDDDGDGDVRMGDDAAAQPAQDVKLSAEVRANLLRDAARDAVRDDAARCTATIAELEKRGAELAEDVRQAERVHMRLFQRLERADTSEQVDKVRRVFEAESGMALETGQPAVYTKRTIDKTKPRIRLDGASSRILRVNL